MVAEPEPMDIKLAPYAIVDPIAQLERAAELLEEARTAYDIRTHVRPVFAAAEAFAAYARQAQVSLSMQNQAAAIKLRAEHKAGELLIAMPKQNGARPPDEAGFHAETPPTYQELGIHKTDAHRWQQIARLPRQTLDAYIDQSIEEGAEITSAGARALASAVTRTEHALTPLPRPASVCDTDQEALLTLIGIHAVDHPRILDVTHNRGRMWAGLPFKPHRGDRDSGLKRLGFTDTVADFRSLPFGDSCFDVIVFDPPHLTHAAGALAGTWAGRYGLDHEYHGNNVSECFAPFLQEAARVLEPDGIVLAKIIDVVHGGVYQWQHLDLVLAAREAGFTPCDLMLKVDQSRSGLIDPRWRTVRHVRNVHTFWLVLRKGHRCDRPQTGAAQ